MMPFSMMNMISDFINAYVLGNIGFTSTAVGACATFLYNLHNAYHDIQSGRIKVAIVGASEAPDAIFGVTCNPYPEYFVDLVEVTILLLLAF